MHDQRLETYGRALDFAASQVAATIERSGDYFPIYTQGGVWHHDGELWTDWTGGFFAGQMWQFFRRTGDAAWRGRAEHFSRLLERRQHDRNVHDLGFIFLNTYRPWFELTGDPQLRDVLVQAGRTLALRFQEKGQYLCSFIGPESLFIDIMMNVPIIFYAARETSDGALRRIAEAHCRTTRDTLVRPTARRPTRGCLIPTRDNSSSSRRTRACAATAAGPAGWPGRSMGSASRTPCRANATFWPLPSAMPTFG